MYKDVPPHGIPAVDEDRVSDAPGGTPHGSDRRLRIVDTTETRRDTPAEILGSSVSVSSPRRQLGSPESWDDMVRRSLASERAIERLRDAFESDYRRWPPGTLVDIAVLNDRAALSMLRRFLRRAKKSAVVAPSIGYRSGGQVVKRPPRSIARKVRCWEIQTPYSWILLLPSGELALQAHPDEFSKIVTDDGRDPVVVAGINAPQPYGLSADDIAAFILDSCRLVGMEW